MWHSILFISRTSGFQTLSARWSTNGPLHFLHLEYRSNHSLKIICEKSARENRKKVIFLSNFQEALLGVPAGRSGWLIAHCSCIEVSLNPVPEIFLQLNVDDQVNVRKSRSRLWHYETLQKHLKKDEKDQINQINLKNVKVLRSTLYARIHILKHQIKNRNNISYFI